MELLIPVETNLRNSGMHVTREWLQECIEYFCEQANNQRIAVDELCSQVKQQWMLGDLRDISPGCLPTNLSDQIKTSMSGIFALQLDYIIDIGTPAYQQFQKLEKIDTTNIEVTNISTSDPSPQRIFKLYLTDGVQNICGIEYRPMRNLINNLTPGIKIQIKGPVDCRRGVLMLEERHLSILGGEVDSLLETNNYKNVLKKKIESSNSSASLSNNFTREKIKSQLPTFPSHSNTSKPIIKTEQSTQKRIKINEEDFDLNPEMFEDDVFDNNIISQVEALENRIIKTETSESSSNCAPEYKFSHTNVPENKMNIFKHSENNRSTLLKNELTNNMSRDNVYPIFENSTEGLSDDIDYFSVLQPPVESIKYPIKVDKNPFIYIKQLLEIPERLKTHKTFIVKAQIFKIVGKLSFHNERWILKCTLVDGSGSLDVDMESQLLSEIIGVTPEKMMDIKKRISSEPQLKNMVRDNLDKAMDRMQQMDCLFHINYRKNDPCIVKTTELTQNHLNQLKQRLSKIV